MADIQGYVPFPEFSGWCEFDPQAVDHFAELLRQARTQVSAVAAENAVRVATRYAAVDTGAIEGLYSTNRGFTRTIAEETATWQAALDQRGETVRRSIEDALAGYDMVLDLVTGAQPLTESWIRQLHEVLCASQETYEVSTPVGFQHHPLPKGIYKSLPNNPINRDTGRVFHYAPPEDTPAEMHRLVEQWHTPEFQAAHPVLQSAYAHYSFVRVHPFADGNGRVSRALASVFLYRKPGVPLVVFADQKDQYIDTLEAADAKMPQRFVSFIADRAIDTIEMIRLAMESAPDEAAALLQLNKDLANATSDMQDEAIRLARLIHDGINTAQTQLALPEGIRFQLDDIALSGSLDREPHIIRFRYIAGGSIYQRNEALVELSRSQVGGLGFVVRASLMPELHVFRRELSPTISETAQWKLDQWLRKLIGRELETFATQLHQAMDPQKE